jgi:hypothetical protein
MTVVESIVRNLRELPARQQVEVARYVHRLSEEAAKERAAVLKETHGCLDETDGAAFEEALAGARRIEAHG